MNKWVSVIFLALFFKVYSAKADGIDRAFQSLARFDYFDAKSRFEKKRKKVPSPSNYGLALIYYRTDNPFHNIDSAYRLVRLAEDQFKDLRLKKVIRYSKYGFDKVFIAELKQKISTYYFDELTTDSSLEEWNFFLVRNPQAIEFIPATRIRDSIALEGVKAINSSEAYSSFLKRYAYSHLRDEAKAGFDLAEYREQTRDGDIRSYANFIQNFQFNSFNTKAQDELYALATKNNSVEDLYRFITLYPENRNKEEAWRRLYQVYMYDYSDDRIEKFGVDFPNYPFKKELKSDLNLARQILLPIEVNGKFGAMDLDGQLQIAPRYDVLGLFNEGIAVVGQNGKYGYINKMDESIIPIEFDAAMEFEQGRAVVEKGGKFGLIDRTGKQILNFEFDDIGTFSDGLIYALKDGLYGYFDKFGEERIKLKYSEAYTFIDGKAKVQIGDKQTYINTNGELLFPMEYNRITPFTDYLLVFENDNNQFGLMDVQFNTVLGASFEAISPLKNGLSVALLEGKLGYIDGFGKMVIPPKFESFPNSVDAAQFEDGHALAKWKDKFGIIDKSGKFVVPAAYNQLGAISNLIAFNKGKLWGFIDLKNKIQIAPTYDWAESFQGNLAIVAKMGQQGVIDFENKEIVPIAFDELSRIGQNMFLATKDEKQGLFSKEGNVIVPIEYKEIRQLDKDFYVLIIDGSIEYLYLPENKIIRLQ